MKKVLYMIALVAAVAITGCNTVNIPEAGNSDLSGVQNLQYSTAGRDLTLSWELPAANPKVAMTGIEIVKNNSELTTIDSLCTSYLIKRAAVNTELTYAVRIKYADGRVSPNASLILTINYEEKARPAMVLLADEIGDLETEEEQGAARWFKKNYVDKGEGNFITPDDLANINMGEVSMIWIHVDRIDISQGVESLPEELTSNAVKTAMRNFLMNGGNMYLSKHATQLITAYGRVNAKYAPNIFNSAEGAQGADVWSINANLLGGAADKRGHAVFAGMQKNSDENTTFPLMGPVYRYDHNCMWDMNQLEFTKAGDNKFEKFEKQTNSEVLATWSHVVDDAVAGLVVFKADDDNFLGTVICNGLAAYAMGNEDNTDYAENNQKMTQNIIEYLK